MGFFFLIVIVGLWAWKLVPLAVEASREASPMRSAMTFERSMRRLASARPAGLPAAPPLRERAAARRTRMLRRRRNVLVGLVAGVALAGAGALSVGGAAWAVLGASAGLLSAYLGALATVHARRARQRRIVQLPVDAPARPESARQRPEPAKAGDVPTLRAG